MTKSIFSLWFLLLRASAGEAERIFLVDRQYKINLKLVVPNVADYETEHLQTATISEQSSKQNSCWHPLDYHGHSVAV